ncbi:helix-turn-helix domain-containing protein [Rhodococcus opacus]|uniref:helix-turn-helix domain-containing protein n=1 Tax=Rhodococcus opacus TaxID=37919 RepID=UPI0029535BDC|nr:helix-turn-helix transcriptional regulator [Rhodococcus opacus]MDV7089477.1 helix-turn-helix transcriptional regulator [Rhodococcus opacus]
MATRSYDDLAKARRARLKPEFAEFATRLGDELEFIGRQQVRLGQELAEARRLRHLTQGELAAKAHVGQPEISKIECGLGNPTHDTLVRLLAALGAELKVVPTVVV